MSITFRKSSQKNNFRIIWGETLNYVLFPLTWYWWIDDPVDGTSQWLVVTHRTLTSWFVDQQGHMLIILGFISQWKWTWGWMSHWSWYDFWVRLCNPWNIQRPWNMHILWIYRTHIDRILQENVNLWSICVNDTNGIIRQCRINWSVTYVVCDLFQPYDV